MQGGGIETLLDLCTSASIPANFGDSRAASLLYVVIAQLVESYPLLGLPSLLKRAQAAIDAAQPMTETPEFEPYFAAYLKKEPKLTGEEGGQGLEKLSQGTAMVKSLVNAQSLIRTLYQCFPVSSRSNSVSLLTVNVFDYYTRLVKSLGPLLRSSISQDMAVKKCVPSTWVDKKDSPTPIATRPGTTSSANGQGEAAPDAASAGQAVGQSEVMPTKNEQSSAQYRNYKTLSGLLHSLMPSIFPLLQTLGRALLNRREREQYYRAHHVKLAEVLAETMLAQLDLTGREPSQSYFNYWAILTHAITEHNSLIVTHLAGLPLA